MVRSGCKWGRKFIVITGVYIKNFKGGAKLEKVIRVYQT